MVGTQTMTIRMLLIDDHALFRESLSRLLETEPDFQMAGSCGTADEGLRVFEAKAVDLVLLDYDLGDETGRRFLTRAREAGYSGPILILTAGMSDVQALEVLQLGAAGIFLKHNSPSLLTEVIHSVVAGQPWLDARFMRVLAQAASQPAARPRSFTERERDVLRGVFEGLGNKEIADRLGISESSVKAALQQLFNKTGVRTRSQLVRMVLEHFRHQL